MIKVLLWQNCGERKKNCGKKHVNYFTSRGPALFKREKSLYTLHTLCFRYFKNFVHHFHQFSLSIQDSVLSASHCPQSK
ncbi:hypothetical protein GIB67_034401 [Kingdonia uniflora]|uniref:Uncharacterized protein n=1 Tax=Kingdonia uniflora TaxID=39325 RepID=A0A7J7NS72_9MAGN|nr:hypothetical protein GIB67_034401 [Kingdonia uniflora]